MSFTDLEEFSSYRVTVTAVYDAFDVTRMASSNVGFTTLSAGTPTYIISCFGKICVVIVLLFVHTAPTGVPRRVSPSSTSTSIMVTWDTIDCIEHKGVITSYSVEFHEEGGADIPGEMMGQSFTASGLTPNTSYTFRVAGVNANGTGPFTENITINTDMTTEAITTNSEASFHEREYTYENHIWG